MLQGEESDFISKTLAMAENMAAEFWDGYAVSDQEVASVPSQQVEEPKKPAGKASTKVKKSDLVLYSLLATVGILWLWSAKAYLPFGSNASELLGYDAASIGLPLLLLQYALRKLNSIVRGLGVEAPGKIVWSFLSFVVAIREFSKITPLGFRLGCALSTVSMVLLFFAFRARRKESAFGAILDF